MEGELEALLRSLGNRVVPLPVAYRGELRMLGGQLAWRSGHELARAEIEAALRAKPTSNRLLLATRLRAVSAWCQHDARHWLATYRECRELGVRLEHLARSEVMSWFAIEAIAAAARLDPRTESLGSTSSSTA